MALVPDYRELARSVAEKAVERGADEADCILVASRVHHAEVARGRLEFVRTSLEAYAGLRVVRDKKVAVVATSDLSRSGIENLVDAAISIARASSADVHWRSLPRGLGASTVEGLVDGKVRKLSPEDLVERVEELVAGVREHEGVELVRASLRASYAEVAVANSYGDAVTGGSTRVVLHVETSVEEGGTKANWFESEFKRRMDDVDFYSVGERSATMVRRFLGAKPMGTGKYDVVLTPKVAADVIDTMVSGPVSADWVLEGRSPLAGKLGKEVASDDVTLVDDPHMPWGFGSAAFDDEGVRTRTVEVISRGVLRSYLTDTYTAGRMGTESTGNAHRKPWSRPRPAPNNLVLKPGDAGFEEMLLECRRCLVVYGTVGAWLSNPVSGFLNVTVTHGVLLEGGREIPVKGVIVSGDFWEIMRSKVALIGAELENYSSTYAPAITLRDMTVSGE